MSESAIAEIRQLTPEELLLVEWREFIRTELIRLSSLRWDVAFQTNMDSVVFACYWETEDGRVVITLPSLSIARLSAGDYKPELSKYAFLVVRQRLDYFGK